MYGVARIFAAAPPDSHNPRKWTTAFWKNSKIIGLDGGPAGNGSVSPLPSGRLVNSDEFPRADIKLTDIGLPSSGIQIERDPLHASVGVEKRQRVVKA